MQLLTACLLYLHLCRGIFLVVVGSANTRHGRIDGLTIRVLCRAPVVVGLQVSLIIRMDAYLFHQEEGNY